MPDIIAGKYEVLETIGRGGMGTVYKARQINLDRVVAIKMLSEELASDPEFRARFQQEATVVARLNHPNIVQVHDIEPHKNTFCIIMEFVEGENLQHKIDRDVTLPEVKVMGIGAQVARALNYAHTRGIIHRDIKPDNIHVTPKGIAKVMDFGIARFLDSKLKTQTGISMGTPKFMSPEQVTGKNVDGQTDLYSLGICLYYCLGGRPPFEGENAISVATRHLYEQPEPPSKLNPSISPAVEEAILKALEKQKKNRYKTGTEMADALEAAVADKTPLRGIEKNAPAGDATMKMPAQTYGTPASGMNPSAQGTPSAPGDSSTDPDGVADTSAGTGASSGAELSVTPSDSTGTGKHPGHTIPELDASFRTPNAAHDPANPTQDFRKAIVVFGSLIMAALALLIILVLWLRASDSNLSGDDPASGRSLTPIERLQSIDVRATQLLAANDAAGARQLWVEFQREFPDLEQDRVSDEIRNIETRLPVTETEVLAKRRYKDAFDALNNQQRALAFAYLKSAVNLSPDLAESAFTTNTLQNLERILTAAPGPVAVQSATTARTQAAQKISDGDIGAATQLLLVQAVETDYSNPANWELLGDYFIKTQNVDAARVMYSEAVSHTQDAAVRSQLQEKLAKISR